MQMEAAQTKIVLHIKEATVIRRQRKKGDMMEWLTLILTGISSVLSGVLSGILLWKFKQRTVVEQAEKDEAEKKHTALVQGVVAMLRDRLIDVMDYHIDAGWCPVHKVEVINKMYLSYHDLGGNDIVSKTYQRFVNLPHQPGDGEHV